MADKPLKSMIFPGLLDKYTIPEIDDTLTQQGEAADAKKTGDEISGVKNTLNQVEDAIAYVQDGDTASRTYTAGQFVYLKNHATLAEGLYTVNSGGIPSGTTVTGHLTADASGGLNSLKNSSVQKQQSGSGTENGVSFDNMSGSLQVGVTEDGNGFFVRLYKDANISYRIFLQSDHGYIQKFDNGWITWSTLY